MEVKSLEHMVTESNGHGKEWSLKFQNTLQQKYMVDWTDAAVVDKYEAC